MLWRGEPIFTPTPALIDDEILRAAERRPARPAITAAHSGRTLTFGQLADGVVRLAGGLAAQGIGRGDVVVIAAGNGRDYAVALYGALAAGAAVASANPALKTPELAHHLALAEPRLVFVDARSEAAVRGVGGTYAIRSLATLDELFAAPRPSERDPRDRALLFPSSGTTGLPKLATHTHAGTMAFLEAFSAVPLGRPEPTDVVGGAVPFPHLFRSGGPLHALRSGASVVTLPVFELEPFLRALADHRVTVVTATPPLVAALARHPLIDRLDLSALRRVIASAAPCAPELQEAVEARLGCVVGDYLGLTEAWCVAPAADPVVRGSVGRLAANLEAVIVDPETGAWLGPDERGELWIRGPQ